MKIKDIRVYDNVHILEATFSTNGVSYQIQFNSTSLKGINWEMSRRLIYGSLLCLSPDNFKTVLFATVSDRNPSNLKKGQLTVLFEDEFEAKKKLASDKLLLTYTMVESQAYYEAYKHILRGLQNIDPETFPLQNYIIYAHRNSERPKYLEYDTTYDISCILPTSSTCATKPLQRSSYAAAVDLKNEFLDAAEEIEDSHPGTLNTDRIVVQYLQTWPSSDVFGLDESQRKALHLALTNALTIIQGPPGTGKTYLGLKIVKVLLNNRHIWRPAFNSGPILVVCFTNHALDQFLEGMLPFTQRIVRVGSRSKNEALTRYNIRSIRQRLQSRRLRAKPIFHNLEHCKHQLRSIRGKWEAVKKRFQLFQTRILHENSLHILGNFGNEFVHRLLRDFIQYAGLNDGDEQWRPSSLVASWLGITLDGCVSEYDIENFISEDASDFQMVTKNKKQKKSAQPAMVPQINLNPVANADNVDLWKNLIDVEDDETAEEARRMLDVDIVEDLLPLETVGQDLVWGLEVDAIHDPRVQMPWEVFYQNDDRFEMYYLMASARQNIAMRELSKHDFMDDEEAELKMNFNLWDMSLEDR